MSIPCQICKPKMNSKTASSSQDRQQTFQECEHTRQLKKSPNAKIPVPSQYSHSSKLNSSKGMSSHPTRDGSNPSQHQVQRLNSDSYGYGQRENVGPAEF